MRSGSDEDPGCWHLWAPKCLTVRWRARTDDATESIAEGGGGSEARSITDVLDGMIRGLVQDKYPLTCPMKEPTSIGLAM